MIRQWILVLFIAITCFACSKQEESGAITDLMGTHFKHYKNGPGCAIGVVKDGELIFSKGYGYANMDYNIPNTPDSKFYIGSMAKQFCGAALLKLESEGKVNFNRPITDYLPDFPTYGEPITVNHIIHHTSGIRGTSSMQLIAGIKSDFEDFFTANHQYEMIKNQKELNFGPGTEFRYSSGGYIVLAKLVEALSGQCFREYLDEHIFQPLGMKNTFVIDNHREIVKDRVISYFPLGNTFERRSLIFDGMGDGSILTTVNDLLLWDSAFYDDLLGIPNFAERMYEEGKVPIGENKYYGMALETSVYKGYKSVSHNGGMLGFRADLIRFPGEKLSVIVLANHANLHSSHEALQIADLFLKKRTLPDDFDKQQPYPNIERAEGEQLVGKYFSHAINSWRRISYENDTLYYDSGNENHRTPLRKTSDSTYIIDAFDPSATLTFSQNQLNLNYGWVTYDFERFDDTQPSWQDLQVYLGTYYSAELATRYEIFEEMNQIFVRINTNEPFVIFPNPLDARINWNSKSMVWLGYAMMKFKFNNNAEVSGFSIGDNRVGGIWFSKLALDH